MGFILCTRSTGPVLKNTLVKKPESLNSTDVANTERLTPKKNIYTYTYIHAMYISIPSVVHYPSVGTCNMWVGWGGSHFEEGDPNHPLAAEEAIPVE